MIKADVKVVNRLGLHARAAAKLVRAASKFKCRIKILRTEVNAEADAKSILSLLAIAAAAGTELVITFDGEDENEASIEILALIRSGFGENN